jgi:dTDP-4-dehydrorhamnose reductase
MVRPNPSGTKGGLPRVLVLGGTGMLGHVLYRECERRFETHATIRSDQPSEVAVRALDVRRTVGGVHAEDAATVERALDRTAPEVVVNCIYVTWPRGTPEDPPAR